VTFPRSVPGTPPKQLRGFDKVLLAPGKSRTVKFELMRRNLSYWGVVSQEWLIPKGEFVISVGFSSRDLKKITSITPVAP
jgi:beta-glucosidase